MKRAPVTTFASTPVCEAARKMAVARAGCVLVVDGERLLGIFTERDLVSMFTTSLDPPLRDPVVDHMSQYPLTLAPDVTIEGAQRFMEENMIRHVPVVENGLLVGLVSLRDVGGRT